MATIYRLIVENKYNGGTGDGRKASSGISKKGAGKKGANSLNLFGSSRGGVEHGRRMRAINPLLNRATGGYWEKGMRLGRAGVGFVNTASEKGIRTAIGGVGFMIFIAFLIQTMLKYRKKQMVNAEKQNAQNYKSMEVGISAIHGQYSIDRNFWNGKINYNENK